MVRMDADKSRDETASRLAALAGNDPDGGIIPPPPGVGIDRQSHCWWDSRTTELARAVFLRRCSEH